jgi:hypothetical protein
MKRTGLKFIKTKVLASKLLPKQLELKDYSELAINDIKVTGANYPNICADKELEITFVTTADNIINQNKWNENDRGDTVYQDILMVDLSWSDEEIIKQLQRAKDEGFEIILK